MIDLYLTGNAKRNSKYNKQTKIVNTLHEIVNKNNKYDLRRIMNNITAIRPKPEEQTQRKRIE